jgi:RNA recognition motif-containing protein
MSRLIQIDNLPASIDSLVLQRLFELHGVVRSSMIARHIETGCSTGVGFIEMASEEGGAHAIAALNHQENFGRVLSVCWSEDSKNWIADGSRMFEPMNMIVEEMTGKETDGR